jgi:hypothetical protein
MGSIACCTSRQSPSPDGLPARVVRQSSSKPASSRIHPSKEPVPSWGSGYSKPEDIAELRAIFVDKSEDVLQHGVQRQRSTATLKGMKTKLKRHLSRDSGFSKVSGISKRAHRLSVGNSEEEIERRKELREIRRKRIREELSNERIYDDDAKSFTTLNSIPETTGLEIALPPTPNGQTHFPEFGW